MALEINLSLAQKQTISQQQQQSLLILAMDAQELIEFIKAEAEENPLMEFRSLEPYRVAVSEDEENDILSNIASPEHATPEEIMIEQMGVACCREDARIFRAIAGSLDDKGFLAVAKEEIAASLKIEVAEVERCLTFMKTLEPAGVCAESLEECLLIQLRRNGVHDIVLEKIIMDHLQDLADRKFAFIAKSAGTSCDDVKRCLNVIKTLNPRPLNGLLGEPAQYIIPDVILTYDGLSWQVKLNDDWFESYRADEYYIGLYRSTDDDELREYLRQKIGRIKFIRDAVKRRRGTLTAISEKLSVCQAGFFLKKSEMVPLTMNDLANEVGVHVSTISRAIKGKYIQYPYGVVEMRALFAGGVRNDCGGEISREEVKRRIRELIDAEDKAKPYSDSLICSKLSAEGADISRRTVAKYRAEMEIKGASGRKYF